MFRRWRCMKMYVKIFKTSSKWTFFSNMSFIVLFITAVSYYAVKHKIWHLWLIPWENFHLVVFSSAFSSGLLIILEEKTTSTWKTWCPKWQGDSDWDLGFHVTSGKITHSRKFMLIKNQRKMLISCHWKLFPEIFNQCYLWSSVAIHWDPRETKLAGFTR